MKKEQINKVITEEEIKRLLNSTKTDLYSELGKKLIDLQAPENSLVLTPSMDSQRALEVFYEWFHNNYGEKLWCSKKAEISWSDVKLTPQLLTKDIDKVEIINLNKDNNV